MTRETLNKMTVKALRDLARELSLSGHTRMKKAELVEAIAARQASPEPAPAPPAVTAAPEAPSSPPAERKVFPPQLSELGELPQQYGRTQIVLMLQKPGYLYAYWEVREEDLAAARARIGRVDARLVMRAHNLTGGIHTDIEVHCPVGDWFFHTEWGGVRVRVDIGLRAPDGHFIVLAKSNELELPTGGPSDRVDAEWAVQESEFEALYALSGGMDQGDSAQLQRVMREGWGLSSSGWRR
jgi:hypothetical protein